MQLRRRRPLTLLEMVIAFSLTALLISFLFFHLHKMSQMNIHAQKLEGKIFSRQFLQIRLSQIFANLILEEAEDVKQKEPSFYTRNGTNSTELHFRFNNGIDPKADFSNTIKGILLFKDKKLILVLQDLEGKQETRQEVLWQNVEKATWYFCDPKQKNWVQEWNQTEISPPLVKLDLIECGSKETLTFSYLLPGAKDPVTYKKTAGAG